MNAPLTIRERRFEYAVEAISAHLGRQPERAAAAVEALRALDRDEANADLCRKFGTPWPVRDALAGNLDVAVDLLKRVYPAELDYDTRD